MAQHDLDITIDVDGRVRVTVRGAKGKSCLEYGQWLAQIVGSIENQQTTSEFYEPEEHTRVDLHQELNES